MIIVLVISCPVFSCPTTLPPTAVNDIDGYAYDNRTVTININTSLTFSASRTHDNDTQGTAPVIRMYYWYVQNPGSSTWTLSKKTSSDQIYTRTFTSQGIYKVRLYVSDNDGEYSASSQTSLNTCTITVVDNNIYAPVVENRLPEVQSDNRVILNGQVVSTGNEAPFVKIYYGTQDGGTTAGNWASVWEPNPQTGQSGTFSSSLLDGFQSASTYYFRCYAWNSAGSDWDDNTNQQTRTFKFKTAPAPASSPAPGNTQMVTADLDTLQWTAGTGATVHRVYFGNTYTTVAEADELSAAYQGQVSTSSYTITETLETDQTYYWRIDEILYDDFNGDAVRIRKGQVWSFTIMLDEDEDGMWDQWELEYGFDQTDSTDAAEDADEDGLTNVQEFVLKSNPRNYDTDGDGVDDGWEQTHSSAFIQGQEDGLSLLKYDAYDRTVGGIPAIWWYTWWTYCNDHTDAAVIALKDNFIPSTANAALDVDADGLTSAQEYQNSTDPTASSSDDFWVEYTYDVAGNVIEEKQVLYVNNQGALTETCIAKKSKDYDKLGRLWRQRSKINPEGADNNSLDDITLTRYYINGSVHQTVRKGVNATNPSAIEATYDIIVAYTYDCLGRQLTITDEMGYVTTNHYNTYGQLDLITLPGTARTMEYEYDAAGRTVATTNPEGHYETRQYDSRGRVIKQMVYENDTMTTAVSQRRMVYDNLGTLVRDSVMANASSTDPNDPAVDKVTITQVFYNDIDKLVNKITYSEIGRIVESTWSWSNIAEDVSGRGLPTEIQKGYCPENNNQPLIKQRMVYDKSGRVIEQYTDHYDSRDATQPVFSQKTHTEYDSYGRQVAGIVDGDTTISTDDLRTEYVYQGSRKIAQIDPKQLRTTLAYDALGRMVLKTEDADGLARPTTYQYNRLGNLTALIAGDGTNNQTTAYLYDKQGKVTQITYPDNGSIVYQYTDPASGGRPTHRTDQRNITTVYQYDKLGNLLQKQDAPSNPTTVETFTYDARGLMLTALKGTTADPDATSAVTFTYNGLGYITQSTQSIKGGTARTISYARNQAGQPTQIGYPTLTPVTMNYTYTSLGQVDTITRGTQTLADYNYFGSYIAARQYPGPAVTFTPAYDDFGRATSHKTVNSSNVGVDFAYAYDANGNITRQDYLHRTSQPYNGYDYDDLNRLTEAAYQAGTVGTEVFNYDLLGNRLTTTDSRTSDSSSYVHNLVNEYETITTNGTPATILHDAAGNLTRDQRGYLYEYDAENRLTTIRRSDNTLIANFVYDALGRRIEAARYNQSISGTWSESIYRYYYDDQRMVLQTSVSSGTESDIRYFVYGNYIDEVLLMRRISVSADYYYGHDHLYSPVVLFGSTGSLAERYEYDAYGKRTMYDANYTLRLASLIIANPIGFTGREIEVLDRDTSNGNRPRLEIMYYRARYYDPQAGRFISRDMFNYISSKNLYQYVGSSPLLWSDPLGFLETDVGISYGGYAGFGFSFSVTASDKTTGCCNKYGRWDSEGMVEQSVSVDAHVGIGLGGKFEVLGWYADLQWTGPGFELALSGTNVNEECGGPLGCMRICGSVGLNVGNSLEVGKGPLKVSVDITVLGTVLACYQWGDTCSKKGGAAGFCGTVEVGGAWKIFWWGDSYNLIEINGCYAFAGDSEILGENYKRVLGKDI